MFRLLWVCISGKVIEAEAGTSSRGWGRPSLWAPGRLVAIWGKTPGRAERKGTVGEEERGACRKSAFSTEKRGDNFFPTEKKTT